MSIFNASRTAEKERFTQLPSVLQVDENHKADAEYLKAHFCEHKENIQDVLNKFYRYAKDLLYQQIDEYQRADSFVKSLLVALEALNTEEGDNAQRVINEIKRYDTQIWEILDFERSADFQSFQNTIEYLMEYRKKLNLAITLFQTIEWEVVLEVLRKIDEIQKILDEMISFNERRKSEYKDVIRKAPKSIKDALKASAKEIVEAVQEYSSEPAKSPEHPSSKQKYSILDDISRIFRK